MQNLLYLFFLGGDPKVKTLRRSCTVAILSITLAVSVFAGTIHSPGAVPPPPPSGSTTSTSTATDITTTLILAVLDLIQ